MGNDPLKRRLLIGNLATTVNEEELQALFADVACTVVSIAIPKDPRTGNNRGYAFVEMRSQSDAANALIQLRDVDVKGRTLAITLAEHVKEAPKKGSWYKFGAK